MEARRSTLTILIGKVTNLFQDKLVIQSEKFESKHTDLMQSGNF